MESDYITVQQLAFKFDVCYRTILNSIAKGNIRAFRVGPGKRSTWRIHKSEIDRLEATGIIEIKTDTEE